jgi:predicted aspartyl protease
MIYGTFGDEDALLFEIELIAANGLELPVGGTFDTGFSYYLAINDQDLDALEWTYFDQQVMYTARGDVSFDIYLGKVKIDGQEFEIPVHVGQDLQEVLLGRQWLKTRKLVVDMPSGILTLG